MSLTKEARSTQAVREAGSFAISVLSARREQLALRFARRGEDHFEGLPLEYENHSGKRRMGLKELVFLGIDA